MENYNAKDDKKYELEIKWISDIPDDWVLNVYIIKGVVKSKITFTLTDYAKFHGFGGGDGKTKFEEIALYIANEAAEKDKTVNEFCISAENADWIVSQFNSLQPIL